MALFDNAYKIYEQRDDFGGGALLSIAGSYSGPDVSRENQIKNIEYLNPGLSYSTPNDTVQQWMKFITGGIAYYRLQNFSEARRFLKRR